MPKHIFEHPKHKGLFVEQLHYGGQDIRYKLVGSRKIITAETFFKKYGSTLGAVFLPQSDVLVVAETM